MELVTASGDLIDLSRDDDPDLVDGTGRRARRSWRRHASDAGGRARPSRWPSASTSTCRCRQRSDHFGDIMARRLQRQPVHVMALDEVEQVWIKRRIAPPGHDDEWSRFVRRRATATCTRSPSCRLNCTEQMGVAGAVARAAAALPHGLHAQQWRGVAVGNVRRRPPTPRGARALWRTAATGSRRSARSPRSARSQPTVVDEPVLPARLRRVPLHVGAGLARVRAGAGKMEAALAPFAPRPHWGKLFTLSGETIARGSIESMHSHNSSPSGIPTKEFRNPYLDNLLG